MANVRHFDVRAPKEHTILLSGAFGTDATGAIDSAVKRGRGYTVARNSLGLYRVTLAKGYPADVGAMVSLLKSGGADAQAVIAALDVKTNKRIDIQVQRRSVTQAEFLKTAADGVAGDATAELAIGYTPVAAIVRSVTIVPTGALTANDTNYATLTVWKRDSAGANQTKVAEITTQITGGSGNWVAFAAEAMTLQAAANLALAAGSSLTFQIAKTGTGVVVPANTKIVVEMSSVTPVDLISGECQFLIAASNTGLRT